MSISITKKVAFRDSVQEFSNVYTYGSLDPADEAAARSILPEIVAFEKSIHSSAVTFVRARVWSSGGTIVANQMLYQEALSGTGTSAMSAGSFDRERAYLVLWPAGKDVRGKPVTLKKWYHTCGVWPGTAASTAVIENTTGLLAADRTTIATKADEITRVGATEAWGMVADSGRERDGGPPVSHRYLEHHQLGDQWRG